MYFEMGSKKDVIIKSSPTSLKKITGSEFFLKEKENNYTLSKEIDL